MKKHALLIGINRYEDPGISRLLCAEKDAVALEFFLRDRCGFVVTGLINDQATKGRINDEVRHLCAGLGPEDVFLFYFAGHGHDDPHTGRQVLLPVDVRLQDIEDHLQPDLVPVRGIEAASARCGAARFLLLDACRMPLPAGSRDSVARCRDVVAADLKTMVEEECRSSPPLVVLHSCSPNQRAHEVESLGRGVFSKALEEALAESVAEGREVSLPGEAEARVAALMEESLRHYRPGARQNPCISHNRPKLVLLEGRMVGPGAADPNTLVGRAGAIRCEKCPICQKWNVITDTFGCPRCHRDFVCLKHRSETERCCEECAKKLAGERAEAERKAKQEAERQEELRRHALERQRLGEQRKRAEAQKRAREEAEQKAREEAARQEEALRARQPKAGKPWENSLGMKFVPVPGTEVLFCVWETRVRDYAPYAAAQSGVDGSWRDPAFEGVPVTPNEDCPVVCVSWKDARAFCAWLTEKERRRGLLRPEDHYRLPTDAEWSWAVGIGDRESGATPREKDGKLAGVYPWGSQWPPPPGSGNFADECAKRKVPKWSIIDGYEDGYATTSPVGSFPANEHGLYDLAGNVWEWCEDLYDTSQSSRVFRGGSWYDYDPAYLLSSARPDRTPEIRAYFLGFRVVLAGGSA